MAFDRVQVDAVGFEKLIDAVIGGDVAAARSAIDEIAMSHDGGARAQRIIQIARKKVRGIVDVDRPAAEVLPVPGLRVGSTLVDPKPVKAVA